MNEKTTWCEVNKPGVSLRGMQLKLAEHKLEQALKLQREAAVAAEKAQAALFEYQRFLSVMRGEPQDGNV